ncbi:transcription-repair coupling factor [Chloroflexota bacterium]
MPELTELLHLIEDLPGYRRLVNGLRVPESRLSVAVLDAARPYLMAALHTGLQRPVLVVIPQPEGSRKLYDQLLSWCSPSRVKLWPEPDSLPYERIAAESANELERLRVLFSLVNGSETPVIIASALALAWKTAPCCDFTAACHSIDAGATIEPLGLLARWQAMGYRLENVVEVPGTVSHRGGIIDIYPPNNELPVRLDFFGDTVESIRLFDPADQRSLTKVPRIDICPATELLIDLNTDRKALAATLDGLDLTGCAADAGEQVRQDIAMLLDRQRPHYRQFYAALFNTDTVLSYLPLNTLLMLDEPQSIEKALGNLDFQGEELRRDKTERGDLPRNFPVPYFTASELDLEDRPCLKLAGWSGDDGTVDRLDFAPAPGYAGQMPVFIRNVKERLARKQRVILISHEASRLAELLEEADIMAAPVDRIERMPAPGSVTLVSGLLAEGWVMGDDTCLFTDAEIFGFVKQRRLAKKHPAPRHSILLEMAPGDYVVHIEHGVARFGGVITMGADGSEREYLVLHYAAGDKLYVPTDQIDRVNRYVGGGDRPPVLNRLGTQEWARAKQRVKDSVADIAEELLALYAAREVVPGFAASEDTVWQQELESSFPYVETPDQVEVIRQVKEDMTSPRPMDRLVSGDVGYGKTEIAIRAAFKAVMDGKQVAVLVPTTVLAQQHFATFTQRLEAFPVRVEVLSRFKTQKEQQSIIEGMADGTVDICIGTHRLLQKDIIFEDLGLLVIDEEQRFGVTHKEHFKKMRQEVDVLTLSATPIPRTLHMSLVGVRDMSTMETPPEERLPIKTYVAEYDDRMVREAVLRELERNGQVFFVHNRVQSIAFVASKLRLVVPEARIAVAHGQMPEGELERVMTEFAQEKSDVLVCTTIIESGLDMPNANTLIVNRADRFGLTQLYQLRGRVGRGANLAHAYFLYDKGRNLTHNAEKRLQTIFQATGLGVGFDIAMKDLEIRGAGTLLGARQSGHISAVGFGLYTRLLAEAVEEVKEKRAGVVVAKPPPLPSPSIDLPLSAHIPEEYVADIDTRLYLYQKLSRVDGVEKLDDLRQECEDRFGDVPAEVDNLLYAARIKLLAIGTGIETVSHEHGQIVIRLFQGMQFTPQQQALRFPEGNNRDNWQYPLRAGLFQFVHCVTRIINDTGRLVQLIPAWYN